MEHRLLNSNRLLPYILPTILAVVILTIGLLAEPVSLALEFHRDGLQRWQWWRLVTAHLVHLSPGHLGMNLSALALFSLLYAKLLTTKDWATILFGCGTITSLAIYLANPDVTAYVGLSGLVHSMFFYVAVILFRQGNRESWILFALLGGKIIWEQLMGPLPGSESTAGGPVLVEAHLYGSISGIIFASITQSHAKSR